MEKYINISENYPLLAIVIKIVLIVGAIFVASGINKKFWYRRNKADPSLFRKLVCNLVQFALYVLGIAAIVRQIPQLSGVSQTILAGSGIIALGISLSAQETLGNIISGMFIAIAKPFEVGDRVTLLGRDITGTIEDITLRHTVIRTFTNTRIIISNSMMNQEIIENSNIIDARASSFMDVWVAYESDIDKAMEIMADIIGSHPDYLDIRDEKDKSTSPKVKVYIRELGESGIALRANVWTKTVNENFNACSDIRLSLKKAFDEAGIEIPYTKYTILQQEKDNGRED